MRSTANPRCEHRSQPWPGQVVGASGPARSPAVGGAKHRAPGVGLWPPPGGKRSTTARPGPGRVTLRPGSHPSLQPCAAGPGAAESACAKWAAGPSGGAPAQRPPARCTVRAAQVFQPPDRARRKSYVGGVAWPRTRLTTDEAAGSRSQVLRHAAADDDAANPLASLGQFHAASGNCPQNLWVNPPPQALEARPGTGLGSVPNCAAQSVNTVANRPGHAQRAVPPQNSISVLIPSPAMVFLFHDAERLAGYSTNDSNVIPCRRAKRPHNVIDDRYFQCRKVVGWPRIPELAYERSGLDLSQRRALSPPCKGSPPKCGDIRRGPIISMAPYGEPFSCWRRFDRFSVQGVVQDHEEADLLARRPVRVQPIPDVGALHVEVERWHFAPGNLKVDLV